MVRLEFREVNPLDLIEALKKPCPICGKFPTDENSWAGSVGDLGFGIYCKVPCIEKASKDEHALPSQGRGEDKPERGQALGSKKGSESGLS